MGIDHCSSEIAVPEQLLNCTDIIIGLEQMAGKTVAEGMGGSPFSELSFIDRFLNCPLNVSLMITDFHSEN